MFNFNKKMILGLFVSLSLGATLFSMNNQPNNNTDWSEFFKKHSIKPRPQSSSSINDQYNDDNSQQSTNIDNQQNSSNQINFNQPVNNQYSTYNQSTYNQQNNNQTTTTNSSSNNNQFINNQFSPNNSLSPKRSYNNNQSNFQTPPRQTGDSFNNQNSIIFETPAKSFPPATNHLKKIILALGTANNDNIANVLSATKQNLINCLNVLQPKFIYPSKKFLAAIMHTMHYSLLESCQSTPQGPFAFVGADTYMNVAAVRNNDFTFIIESKITDNNSQQQTPDYYYQYAQNTPIHKRQPIIVIMINGFLAQVGNSNHYYANWSVSAYLQNGNSQSKLTVDVDPRELIYDNQNVCKAMSTILTNIKNDNNSLNLISLFGNKLEHIYNHIPAAWHEPAEKFYQMIFFYLLTIAGNVACDAEPVAGYGVSDIVMDNDSLKTGAIIEFKYKQSPNVAYNQILNKDYCAYFQGLNRTLCLIGLNIKYIGNPSEMVNVQTTYGFRQTTNKVSPLNFFMSPGLNNNLNLQN